MTEALNSRCLDFIQAARAPRLRTMLEFAESEIFLPTGPFRGLRYRSDRQPFNRVWFDLIDSHRWSTHNLTGPSQSSKTVTGSVIPVLYHLFEVRETVVYAVPTIDMARDKWEQDLLPMIEQTRYRDLLPKTGRGVRGGFGSSLRFGNGVTIRFMSGGGSDKTRAGFTARVLVITETDGFDDDSDQSREGGKIAQLRARLQAFGSRARIYQECTVSTTEGQTWQDHLAGTHTRLVIPCPHCHVWVSPEREHLVGWKDAAHEEQAAADAALICPECSVAWSEDDRIAANHQVQAVHDGQEVTPDGEVVGDPKPTRILSFRWNAANNLLVEMPDVARREWQALRAPDQQRADLVLRQFWWTIPADPVQRDVANLEVRALIHRTAPPGRGIVPPETKWLTLGLDLGKRLCHWTLIAWQPDARGQIVDYGRVEVAGDAVAIESALLIALRDFHEQAVAVGWPVAAASKSDPMQLRVPDLCTVDARWQGGKDTSGTIVYQFVREAGEYPIGHQTQPGIWLAGFGSSATQAGYSRYSTPRKITGHIRRIGDHYHIARLPRQRVHALHIDVDHWKSWTHERFRTPVGHAGAMTLFDDAPHEHVGFAQHLIAEREVERFDERMGLITEWKRIHQQNHWLDATMLACCGAGVLGVQVVGSDQAAAAGHATTTWRADRADPRESTAASSARDGWFDQQKGR